ncbi:uncharacterized protein LOC112457677 [Temnothorax curvispinosus]|uniref:Uncharacterized protein LOC112457677 n=1 Tax=Temnothorax curvispinosus TaxID=300111 RepID=A0A6J1Q4N2_9HYME|nr:uncharacterized protein LOC112457677 [Temnothorax curvispinosus]
MSRSIISGLFCSIWTLLVHNGLISVIAFRDSSCSWTVPRNFPRVHSIAPARRGRFVPAKVRTPRKCQIAFARFERRTVLSLDRLSRTSSARRGSRRRKPKEENRLGRGAVRREKGEETPGRRRNARRGSRHARTHSRTHVRTYGGVRTYVTHTSERAKRIEWALASPRRGLVTSACPKEKQKE